MSDTAERATESILFTDVGSLWTNSLLIDQVDGEYRFIARGSAPTTIEPPVANVTTGVRKTIASIASVAGRQLLDDTRSTNGHPITPETMAGEGVDVFSATTSASPALHLAAFCSNERDASIVQRAARRLTSNVEGLYTAEAPTGRWSGKGMAGAIEEIVSARPDILILADTNAASPSPAFGEMLDAVEVVNNVADVRERPTLIIVGTTRTINAGTERVQESNITETIIVDPDDSPAAAEDALSQRLTQYYHNNVLARLPGFGALQSWSTIPIRSTASTQARAIQLLARETGNRILFVNVGDENSNLIAIGDGFYHADVRPKLGAGYAFRTLLESEGPERIFRWMPGLTPERDLHGLLMHRTLYPRPQPATRDALWLEQAVARVIIQRLIELNTQVFPDQLYGRDGHPTFDYIIGSGFPFNMAPEPAQAVLMLLDAVQPIGVTHLLRDRLGVLPAAGMLADREPAIVNDLLSHNLVESLGTVIVPVGDANPGDTVLNFRMNFPDGGFYDVSVEAGDIYREYIPANTTFELELAPARGIDVGLGRGKRVRVTVSGGSAGLFIDARGRPLPQQEEVVDQRRQVQEWVLYVGG